MRELTEHETEGGATYGRITLIARDGPGDGGACHAYVADWHLPGDAPDPAKVCVIDFQNGPIPERGVNGITNEVLLAIVADRLRGFQSGRFACIENQEALAHIEGALAALKGRTAARIARGAEGTHAV